MIIAEPITGQFLFRIRITAVRLPYFVRLSLGSRSRLPAALREARGEPGRRLSVVLHPPGPRTAATPRITMPLRRMRCVSTSQRARMRRHQTAAPRMLWPAIPRKGGACSATVSCCSTTRGNCSLMAALSPVPPPERGLLLAIIVALRREIIIRHTARAVLTERMGPERIHPAESRGSRHATW
jgi:hypothetical protein